MIARLLLRLTRSRLIGVWFAFVVLAGALAAIWGASPSGTTAFMLAAIALVPPAMVLMLWPGVQPQTAAEVIRGDGRGR